MHNTYKYLCHFSGRKSEIRTLGVKIAKTSVISDGEKGSIQLRKYHEICPKIAHFGSKIENFHGGRARRPEHLNDIRPSSNKKAFPVHRPPGSKTCG